MVFQHNIFKKNLVYWFPLSKKKSKLITANNNIIANLRIATALNFFFAFFISERWQTIHSKSSPPS